MAVTGAQLLVEALLAEGVELLFGIPGVGTLAVYDAFVDNPGLRHIEVRHEQSSVFMADGYARASGRVGVAFTSNGPGALNTITAMATAHNDSVPVLHLVSENPPEVRRKGKGHFHDISDQFGIFRPVSGHAAQVALAEEIPAAVNAAFFALRNRRPRTALVEFANEALTTMTSAPVVPGGERVELMIDPASVARAAEILATAKRPLVWAGGGVATIETSAILTRIVERLGTPTITTQKGKGAIPSEHPLHIGNWANEQPVRDLIDECDVLLAVGTRFSYFPTGGWSLRLPGRIVQIDLDPTEIGRNYPVEAGVVGDAGIALSALESELDRLGHQPLPWRDDEVAKALGRITEAVGAPIEIEVLDQIRSALPPETLVFNDPTTIAFWARSHWKTDRPRTWFVPSGFGTLGYALPAAIGARLARPDNPTIAIIGDAGVMFTIQDLMTAVQENVPVVVLVFNDEGYGVERRHQDHLYGRRSGVDVRPPDFVALAHSFGAQGILVDDLSRVGKTVESVLDAEGPIVIEIPNRFSHPGYGSFGSY
ncbi:MAG: thiamine pyrophosphate protein binding domain protein [Acidimicrobiia bacterium]|nr:thiamine pyrophosphate protein binding domain protein [Acidimicrobiia bacterium]